MLETGLGRDATLISLGGGVICDMGGFFSLYFYARYKPNTNPNNILAQGELQLG
ncbi:MAG: hypothetical protein Ct9H300mP6_17950 [Gammaproteobacteria bacterium]|nr:MAG: hypothetical protein Ct9H300mP6_17950 [Gammaproteobacteria bacterium]